MDFVEGVTHYIVVEDMSWDPTTKLSERNCEGFEALQNTLIHGLQIAKPTMVVAAGPMDYGIEKLIDLARRGVPTLLLDCRRRWSLEDFSTHVAPVSASNAKLARMEMAVGPALVIVPRYTGVCRSALNGVGGVW